MFTRVRIVDGQSQYDIFCIWGKSALKAFREMGIPADSMSVSESMRFVDEDTLTIGFNMSRTWAVENVRQYHFAWLVDHPVFHAEYFMPDVQKIPVNQNRCIAGCVSEAWTTCGRILYPGRTLHFIPHASSLFEAHEPDWDNRILDVVFFGSIQHPEALLELLKEKSGRFWPFIASVMNAHTSAATYQAPDYLLLDALLAQKLDTAQTIIMMNAFFPMIDQYFRNLKRLELLRGITKTPVHVFGNGPWRRLGLPDNVMVHESVPYREALGIMRQSKILLNHTPTLMGGAHERIFDAISNGCSVVTTWSDYLKNQLGTDSGVRFYDPLHPDGVEDILTAVLDTPDKGEIGRHAQEIVLRHHTMRNRVRDIWELANNTWKAPAPHEHLSACPA